MDKINAEYVFTDALDNIFKHLKVKDLFNAALVCKLWYKEALKEMYKKKIGPQISLLPHVYNTNFSFNYENIFEIKPFVSILFTGPSFRERQKKNLESEALQVYRLHFENYLVAVGVDESILNEKTIISCPGLLGDPNGIQGLFFPIYKDVAIKVIVTFCYEIGYVESFRNYLLHKNNQMKQTIIMFSNAHGNFMANEILDVLKSKLKPQTFTLWGGHFDDHLRTIPDRKSNDFNTKKLQLFILIVSGLSIESWSTIIDCTIEKKEFNKKLLQFKQNVQVKRFALGLACGPRYVEKRNSSNRNMYKNSHELMNIVKQTFHDISFTGIFNFGYHPHYGVDSTSTDTKQNLKLPMALSLMIISYN